MPGHNHCNRFAYVNACGILQQNIVFDSLVDVIHAEDDAQANDAMLT